MTTSSLRPVKQMLSLLTKLCSFSPPPARRLLSVSTSHFLKLSSPPPKWFPLPPSSSSSFKTTVMKICFIVMFFSFFFYLQCPQADSRCLSPDKSVCSSNVFTPTEEINWAQTRPTGYFTTAVRVHALKHTHTHTRAHTHTHTYTHTHTLTDRLVSNSDDCFGYK